MQVSPANELRIPRLRPRHTLPFTLLLLLLLHRPGAFLVLEREIRRPLVRSSLSTPSHFIASKQRTPQPEAEQETRRGDAARERKRPPVRQLRVQVEGGEEVVYRRRQERGVRVGIALWVAVGIEFGAWGG